MVLNERLSNLEGVLAVVASLALVTLLFTVEQTYKTQIDDILGKGKDWLFGVAIVLCAPLMTRLVKAGTWRKKIRLPKS